MSALLVALLAVATNLATNAVPDRFTRWTDDPWWTWGATVVLVGLVIVVAVALQRQSSSEPGQVPAECVGGARRLHNLPPRNPSFVGRDAVFDRIEAEFARGPVAVAAMHGLGGMGKSAIALELAHRGLTSGRYAIAWWVRAETESTLVEDFTDLAPALAVTPSADQDQTVEDVHAALQSRTDWLIVFDNVASPEDVRSFLPGGSGATLITSRFRGWGAVAVQIDIDRFTREESLVFLAGRGDRGDPAAADALAQALGDLALALVQATAYVDLHDLPIARYLELYRDRDSAGHLLAEAVDGYPASVATTWLLHYDQLDEDEPAALQLLRLCAFLDAEDIDLGIMLSVPDLLPPELAAAAVRSIDRERVVGALVRTHLVTRTDADRISVHRLVSQVTRLHLGPGAGAWARRAVALVNRLFPLRPQDVGQWPLCALLSAHASIVIEHAENLEVSDEQASSLFDRLGAYLQSQVGDDVEIYSTADAGTVDDAALSPVQSRYLNQIRRIAPQLLADRDRELADLAAFCTSDGEPGYLQLVAAPWSGKTALLSWFALHPPTGVRVVSFFVTGRLAGQDDRSAFVDNVIEQLLVMLGRESPVFLTEAGRDAAFLNLLGEAAQACFARGERLVLLVDGLDEDRGAGAGPATYSIAALLPADVPRGLRVVVGTRPHPPLPSDLPHHHALRAAGIVRHLNPSAHAQHLRVDMERELSEILNGGSSGPDVLGLITASGGGLSVPDLRDLTGSPEQVIQEFVTRRIFAKTERNGVSVYSLAYAEGVDAASAGLGPARLAECRAALHAWADDCRARGWRDDTPDYLLAFYPQMLLVHADPKRLVDFATDVSRHKRMRQRFGDNESATSEVRTALEAVASPRNAELVVRLAARWAGLRWQTFLVDVRSALRGKW
ncbi:NB-ARC domain-containing protein [Lentzea sp. NPDC102401]|uniref:DUF7779 domain-containing protein n=1 Tax=Lentzea sp. NPDC102401 TaxID=3364128 RepID=UPI0038002DCD